MDADASQATGQWTLQEETELVDFLSKHLSQHMDLGLFKKPAYTAASDCLTQTFGTKTYFTQEKCASKWTRVCLIAHC